MSTTDYEGSQVTDTTEAHDTVDGEVVSDTLDTGTPDETEADTAEVAAEDKPKSKRTSRANKNAEKAADKAAGSEVAVREAPEAKPVTEKSSFTPAKARALTDRLVKSATNAVELFIEAYNGRIWLAYGYESWQQYLDAELGELRPRLPKPQRLEITGRMKSEAKMSQTAIAAALGVDQKTVSNDLKELRGDDGDAASDTSVGLDGVERSSGDRSGRRKPFVERVSAVFEKMDKAFGDLTELAVEEEWETELGAIANRHRPDVARFIGQLQGLRETFNGAPDFDES